MKRLPYTVAPHGKRATANERLKQERHARWYNTLIYSHNIFLIRTDMEGRYTYANPRFIERFGFIYENLVGSDSMLSILPEDHDICFQTVMQCLANPGVPQSVVLRKPNHQGGVYWTQWEFVTVTGEAGQPEIQCLGFDITAHKEAEDRLMQQEILENSLRKEQELSALKSRMMTRIAHEFRTPLAAIQAATDMLNYYGNRMDAVRRANKIASIYDEVQRITLILDDITRLVTDSSIATDFHPITFDLIRLVNQIIERVRIVDQSKHPLVVHHQGIHEVYADPHLIESLLTNLLTNALKYSAATKKVEVTFSAQNSDLILVVSDQGIGISNEELPHIFEPFFRGNSVPNVTGVGLGLAIVQYAVKAHQGTLAVKSTVGVGTSFQVRLPEVLNLR